MRLRVKLLSKFKGIRLNFIHAYRPSQTRTHCCGHIVADTNVSPFTCARNICCGHKFCVRDTKKMFPILFRDILRPQQMFPKLHSPRNIMSNNVSATMCPCLNKPGETLYGVTNSLSLLLDKLVLCSQTTRNLTDQKALLNHPNDLQDFGNFPL